MIDSNGPVLNTRLEKALRAMLEDNNDMTRNQMVNALMKATMLSPVIREVAVTEEAKKMGNARLRFSYITNIKGEKYFMAFTDWGAVNRWKQDTNQQVVHVDFDDLAAICLRDGATIAGFVINPMGENVSIPNAMIKSLKEQKERIEQKKH